MNIGLIGLGTVGTGVVKIIAKSAGLIKERSGVSLTLKTICETDLSRKRDVDLTAFRTTPDADDVLGDPEIDVVVELIGGYEPARAFVLGALKKGKHVVTANKALLARHGGEIHKAAAENGVQILYEAAVGACIPILRALKDSLVTENISSISGILNGTTNYILTKMTRENQSYEEALKKAQELGFAEADPTFDVEGKDAAHKLAIMASIATGSFVSDEEISTEGITGVTKDDIKKARESGKVIKLVASYKKTPGGRELSVRPTLLDEDHPLAGVQNELNAVFVVGDNVGEMMLYGKGAGQLPTASAVVADVVTIGRNRV
ncbi:MAG: homoserine dehydrogenase [Acidobacteriota bacterium]|nr:MAG: homoserine dehydrogenase [Acidobacteriota bacterium]